jgi:GntR family transcriptional regulator, rspAB operon transcriptional repressor
LIREVVEVEVCRRACRMASEEDLDSLSTILDEQERAAIRQDMRRFYELDEAFHRRIFQAADCTAVADELEDVKAHLNRLRFVTVNWPNRPNAFLAEHRDVLEAMAARDEQASAAAMTLHLRTILQVLDNIGTLPV